MGVDGARTKDQPGGNPAHTAASPLTLTVAICTRDRPQQLSRALASLLEQQQRPQEILVIDNASSGAGVQTMMVRDFPAVRYVKEFIEGLDFARNCALREARGTIVAFLDDDAVAHPGWTAEILKPFADENRVSLVTGRVEALSLDTDAARLFEANGGYGRGMNTIQLPADARKTLYGLRAPLIAWAVSVGNGTNFALRKDSALAINGFDEAFDMGKVLHGGGDLDMFWRMLDAGYNLEYQPSALVRHEHRSQMSAMAEQLADHQRALAAFLVKSVAQASGKRRIGVLVFLLWRLIKPGIRLLKRAAGQDPLPARILLAMWAAAWGGLFAYPRAQTIARQRKKQAEALP